MKNNDFIISLPSLVSRPKVTLSPEVENDLKVLRSTPLASRIAARRKRLALEGADSQKNQQKPHSPSLS